MHPKSCQIIDVSFPPACTSAESSLSPSRELAVSRRVLLSFQTNHAGMFFDCLDERFMSSGVAIQAVSPSSLANFRPHAELSAL